MAPIISTLPSIYSKEVHTFRRQPSRRRGREVSKPGKGREVDAGQWKLPGSVSAPHRPDMQTPRLLVEPAKAEVLDLKIILQPILGALAPEARLLHAAEGRLCGRDQTGVDPNNT